MDQPHSNWRAMFDSKRQERPPGNGAGARPAALAPSPFGYDDGHEPGRTGQMPPSPQEITDEAAAALASAQDPREYRPWILQRGRSRPVPNLHLRRFEARSGQWQGWIVPYAHFVAAEYLGDGMLSLDFGTRHFLLEGRGLGDNLITHLHEGTVLCLQEYASQMWNEPPHGQRVQSIRLLADNRGSNGLG